MTDLISRFENIANSWTVGFRDVEVNAAGDKAKLGNLFLSGSKAKNDQTMLAFRDALSKKYGVFGEHAFDSVLGARSQLHKSLPANLKLRLVAVGNNICVTETRRQRKIQRSRKPCQIGRAHV